MTKTYFQRERLRPPFIPAPWGPIALETTRPWEGPPFLAWPEGVEGQDPNVVRQLLHEMMWALMEPGMHPPFALEALEAWETGVEGGRPGIPGFVKRLDTVLEAIEKNRQTRETEDLEKLAEDSKKYPLWAANFVKYLLRKEEGGEGGASGEGEGEDGEGKEESESEGEAESEEESEATKGGGGKGGEGTSGEEGSGEGEGEEEGESGDGGEGQGEGEEGEGGDEEDGDPEEAEGSDEGDPSENQDVEVEIHVVAESATKVQGEQAGEVEKDEETKETEEPKETDSEPAAAPEPLPGPGQEGRLRSRLAALLPDLRHFGTPDLDPSLTETQLRQLAIRLENTPNIDKLLAMIGRLSSSAWMPAKRVTSTAREDVRDVTLGSDFSSMLPTELMRFAIPALAPQAYLDLIEGRLNVLEFEGTEPRGRGPILLAIDVSPSMEDPADGEFQTMPRMQVASMIALAMVRAAAIQKRIVVVVGFAGTVIWVKAARHLPEYVELQSLLLDLKRGGLDTNFDPPLKALLGAAAKHPGGDLVFLTDGVSAASPAVAQALAQARAREGLRLFTLLLGPGKGLEALSDLTIPVMDLDALEHMSKEVTKMR